MVTRPRLNRRSRTRLALALATLTVAVVGVVVAMQAHRSVEQAYATALADGPGRSARVETLLHTKQSKTIVGVRVDGTQHTVDIATGSRELRVGMGVEVHRGTDERVPLAIDGTEPWSWWGTMVQVFGALAVVALAATVYVVVTNTR